VDAPSSEAVEEAGHCGENCTPKERRLAKGADGDRQPIPESDMPAGLPPWMHENDGWATRTGTDALKKRRNITITVPKGIVS